MTLLSASDLLGIAAAAGFSGPDLATAAAIALAESSGNPQAVNPEGSYGLWQIYLKDHPEFSSTDLFQPDANAAAAFTIYQQAGASFRPWSTFKSGAYMKYMPTVTAAVLAATGIPTDQSGSGDGGDSGGGTVPATSILPVVLLGAGALLWLIWMRG